MIFDSHAHYSRKNFDNEFGAWFYDGEDFDVGRFTRDKLFEEMKKQEISGVIEPSVEFDAIPTQLEVAGRYPDFIRVAVGVHPTRCFFTKWKNRKKLEGYLKEGNAVAVGETGLDYHHPRKKQRRLKQKAWFVYQIKLADKMGLPLVLHIRAADKDALKILKKYRGKLHGGVAHCFTGEPETAIELVSLGFAVGIGGYLLNGDETSERLCRALEKIPLESILLETDAPFVSPLTAGEGLTNNQRSRIRNSSLILPAVAEKIAEIKGVTAEEAENTTAENCKRIFGIN